MKRIVSLILVIMLVILCSSCGATSTSETVEDTISLDDNGFLINLQKALEARWSLSNNEPSSFSSSYEQKQAYTQYVKSELDAIGDISEYTFSDEQLRIYANQYVDALNSQLEGIKYLDADNSKYNKLFNENGYFERARVIFQLVDKYGLTVSSEYENVLDEFVTRGRVRLELDDVENSLTKIISHGVTLESLGGWNYECVLKNDSQYDLSGAAICFNLYDKRGILVESTTAYMNSWKAGSVNKCDVFISKEFSKAEVMIEIFNESLGDFLRTEYYPVDVVNNMQIMIKLKTKLPQSYDYYLSRRKTTTCTVTSIKYEVGFWSEGTASVTMSISGEKTYDKKGNNYSRAAQVDWKLYNESGSVVDSGTFYTSEIVVGESFENVNSYAYNLSPGTYTLELLNAN